MFFPCGLFVAYGRARLLSWRRAALLAVLSYVCIIGFVQLMAQLDRDGSSGWVHSTAILGGVTMYCGLGFLLYRIGHHVGYWSPTAQGIWQRAGWLGSIVFCLACVSVGLQFIVARISGS